jgi:hypothetical protein
MKKPGAFKLWGPTVQLVLLRTGFPACTAPPLGLRAVGVAVVGRRLLPRRQLPHEDEVEEDAEGLVHGVDAVHAPRAHGHGHLAPGVAAQVGPMWKADFELYALTCQACI